MTGPELKTFIEKVYEALGNLVSQGKITDDDKKLLGPEIVRSKIDKEGLEVQ